MHYLHPAAIEMRQCVYIASNLGSNNRSGWHAGVWDKRDLADKFREKLMQQNRNCKRMREKVGGVAERFVSQ